MCIRDRFKYPEKFARIAGEIIAVKQPATNEHREKPMMHHSGDVYKRQAGLCQKDETQPDQLLPGIRLENK